MTGYTYDTAARRARPARARPPPLAEADARTIGARAAPTGHADVVDVSVVVGALQRGDVVLISDPGDIARAVGDEDLVIEPV